MKSKLFLIPLLFLSIITNAQTSKNDKIVFLDSKWKETTSDDYDYYRIIKDYRLNQDSYEIKEYYKSGGIRTEGYSKDKYNFVKDGEIITYFENGNKQKKSLYSNKILIGKEFEWYENGNPKSVKEFTPEQKESQNKIKILQYWNTDNVQIVIDGNGEYEESSKEFYGKGKLKNGYKDGIWEGWQIAPENKYSEEYKNGALVSGTITDKNNFKTIYTSLGQKSQPIYGFTNYYKNLHQKISKYKSKEHNFKGQIKYSFIIETDGKTSEPNVISGINPDIDQKIIQYFLSTNWTPEIKRGQKIRSKYNQPISIK